jgi:large subunit ribosomal protein L4
MASVKVKTPEGAEGGSVELDDSIFGIEPNVAVMHQVVTAQLAASRAGSHSTKTRAERRGGGAKPWKQKGTGRARHGSIRSPQWKGGGVVHGPRPRSYRQRTPKKMVRLALRSALSDRAADNKVIVVDSWGLGDLPRTKDAAQVLSALGVDGRVLVVLGPDDIVAWKSFRNLTHVHPVEPGELNAYDVLVSDWVVFTQDTLLNGRTDETAAPALKPRSGLAQRGTDKPAPKADRPAANAETTTDEPAAEATTAAPVKKKVVKKKVVKKKVVKKVVKKKVVKKKAPTGDDAPAGGSATPAAKPAPKVDREDES